MLYRPNIQWNFIKRFFFKYHFVASSNTKLQINKLNKQELTVAIGLGIAHGNTRSTSLGMGGNTIESSISTCEKMYTKYAILF